MKIGPIRDAKKPALGGPLKIFAGIRNYSIMTSTREQTMNTTEATMVAFSSMAS